MGTTISKSSGNFLDVLPPQGTLHVVMLGLDSAGKTTALYRLKFDQYLNTVPTIGFNCEKVHGTIGKAKGVQFLIWDVGGQEKLRPLWRSYTRCTDGILFVVDSVDTERMEEAKMELMRTAKCPDNQGVPVLILANKQDLPGARDPKEIEKLLSLNELQQYGSIYSGGSSISNSGIMSSTRGGGNDNDMDCINFTTPSSATHSYIKLDRSSCSGDVVVNGSTNIMGYRALSTDLTASTKATSEQLKCSSHQSLDDAFDALPKQQPSIVNSNTTVSDLLTSTTSAFCLSATRSSAPVSPLQQQQPSQQQNYKGWYIQPACAITGEGLQEGLEALYEMIHRRRKLNKKKKR